MVKLIRIDEIKYCIVYMEVSDLKKISIKHSQNHYIIPTDALLGGF